MQQEGARDEFLKDEACERCGGPILAQAHTEERFYEETLDYVSQTVWPCYACGHANDCKSLPYFVI